MWRKGAAFPCHSLFGKPKRMLNLLIKAFSDRMRYFEYYSQRPVRYV